jgi:RimJ/RimL family protein N-acetyltransferase
LIAAIARALPELRPTADFGWMHTTAVPSDTGLCSGRAQWLPPSAAPEINDVLDAAFPDSYARPGTHRWAGVRDPRTGRLAATAALAIGYIAGVATSPAARGQGLARDACALVIARALAAHGAAALIVEDANTPALRLYRSLGLAYRPLGAAGVG